MPPVITYIASYLVAAAWAVGVTVSMTTAMWITSLVVNGALMFGAQKLLGKKPNLDALMSDVTGRTQMVRQAAAVRRLILGRAKVSGPLAYARETGTNREYLHLVILLAGHECEAFQKYFLNEDELTLDGSGNVTAPAKYVGNVRIIGHLGATTQTVDTDLQTETASEWNANCRLRGICYAYARVKFDQEKFPGGLPNFSFTMKGMKQVDPRDGALKSWPLSANPQLVIYNYMLNTEWGMKAIAGDFHSTRLNASCNSCDEDVALAVGGTEKRYTLNGTVDTDMRPGDVLEAFLATMAGEMVFAGGKWHVFAGVYEAPTVTLDESDLRGPIQMTTKLSRRELLNRVKGTYVSEGDGWQPVDFPAVTNATYLSQDDGEILWRDVQNPFVLSAPTAQRLAKIDLEKSRQQIQLRMPCKLTALKCMAGINIKVNNTRFGFVDKPFKVTNFQLVCFRDDKNVPAMGVDLACRETASAVFDWNSGMETATDPAPNTTLPNPFTVSDPTGLTLLSNGTTTTKQTDGSVVPSIKVTWTAPTDDYVKNGGFIRVEYKLTSSGIWLDWTLVRGAIVEEFITAVVTASTYDVRIRSENVYGKTGNWVASSVTVSSNTSVPTTPSAGSLSADGVTPKFLPGTEVLLFGSNIGWAPNNDKDFAYFEVKATTTDTDGAVDYSWTEYDLVNFLVRVTTPRVILYNPVLGAGYVRVRAVNNTGLVSAWYRIGNANSAASLGAGNMAQQSADDVFSTGLKVGNGSSVVQKKAEYIVSHTQALAGGAPSETFNVSLTNRGFGTKPDVGEVECTYPPLDAVYDFDDAGNSSTNAVVIAFTRDGTNIVANTYRFSITLKEI